MDSKTIISVENLTVKFKDKSSYNTVIENLNFKLYENDILGIVGESGSGKSLTALSILKLLPNKNINISGRINFLEKNIFTLKINELQDLRKNDIAIVFQEPMSSLNPTMKCIDQLREVLNNQEETFNLLTKVKLDNIDSFEDKYPHQISGGQKQRLMIAMAIAKKPKILIADEPTTALDVTVQKEIIKLLLDIKKTEKISIIFITHDLALVSEIANRIIVMYKGRVVEEGKTKNIFKKPKKNYTKGLLRSRPDNNANLKKLPTVLDFINNTVNITEFSEDEIQAKRAKIYGGKPILEIKNLNKSFSIETMWFKPKKSFKALKDINLKLFKGETLGLVGESGCGKSTLVKTIVQIEKYSDGIIFFKNNDISKFSKIELKNYRTKVQLIFQDPDSSLNPKMKVGDLIMEPMIVHNLYNNKNRYIEEASKIIKDVGLDENTFNKYPHELSGGQKQRIGIARAISLKPEILIFDESVSALDVSVQAQVLNLLNELKEKLSLTYIFISHDLSVVKYMSDKIIVMKDGVFKELGYSNDIYLHPKSNYTKKLINSIPKGII
ncbi:MAG: ABC transporter ATP-binding protein [Flavobacteriaceae bacterium]|nr:ABC transporter ATP-binding protein [Flavobacteriaceae bacterium]